METLSFQLSEKYSRYLKESRIKEYLTSLSDDGLRWWFEMDTPRIQTHLFPLYSSGIEPDQLPVRVGFLVEASRQSIPFEKMEGFFDAFTAEGDLEGASAVAGAAVASIWDSGGDFERYRPWYKRIEELLEEGGKISTLATASLYGFKGLVELTTGEIRQAFNTFLIQRRFAEEANSCPLRVYFATASAYSLIWMGRLSEAEIIIREAEVLSENTEVNEVVRVYFQITRGLYYYVTGEVQKAKDILKGIIELPFFDALPPPGYFLAFGHYLLCLAALSDEKEIEIVSRRLIGKALPEKNHFHLAYLYYSLGSAYLLIGNSLKAHSYVEESARRAELSKSLTARQMPALLLAQVLSDMRRDDEALKHLERWLRIWREKGFNLYGSTGAVEMANLYLRRGDVEKARRYFEEALTLMPEMEELSPLNRSEGFFTDLKAVLNMDEDSCMDISIEKRPICIYTFGELSVKIADRIWYDRKWKGESTKRLLKALIVCGGTKVSYDTLIDMLWPEMDGDRAENTLKVTISRLRRFGIDAECTPPRWLIVKGRRLSLARPLCGVDSIIFREAVKRCFNGMKDIDLLMKALDLYRDDFLVNDSAEIWIIRHREILREEFLRGTLLLTELLKEAGEPSLAVPYLERAIEKDPLNEEIYEYLIDVHLTRGYPSLAIKAYRRAEEALKRELGITPGPRLIAVARRAGLEI
ncbi:MAG: tetratricopeptide repeat protein [Nitrospirae bacterium]|nr:MAG: tetratricopeptide repeat protein [Nitrospirota bacterium]